MSRPPPPYRERTAPPPVHSAHSPASDRRARSFGGLADVLEPDPDAITSLRRLGAAALAARAPAPIQLQDFAFADTVVAQELGDEEPPPPSGPIYVSDALGNTQCVTPLAFRLPSDASDANDANDANDAKNVDLGTRLRIAFAHVRHAMRGSFEEMRELWAGTAQMVEGGAAASHIDRVLALWSCFQWSRADLTRAAIIGLAVFVTAGAIGVTTLDFGDGTASAAGNDASRTEVRPGRTLDQHTGKKSVFRAKR
jgi:hypothetical protein